jgi:hypothetical protein
MIAHSGRHGESQSALVDRQVTYADLRAQLIETTADGQALWADLMGNLRSVSPSYIESKPGRVNVFWTFADAGHAETAMNRGEPYSLWHTHHLATYLTRTALAERVAAAAEELRSPQLHRRRRWRQPPDLLDVPAERQDGKYVYPSARLFARIGQVVADNAASINLSYGIGDMDGTWIDKVALSDLAVALDKPRLTAGEEHVSLMEDLSPKVAANVAVLRECVVYVANPRTLPVLPKVPGGGGWPGTY